MVDFDIEIEAEEEKGYVKGEAVYGKRVSGIDTNIYAYYYNKEAGRAKYGEPLWSTRVWFPTKNPYHAYLMRRNSDVDPSVSVESNRRISFEFPVNREHECVALFVANEDEPTEIVEF